MNPPSGALILARQENLVVGCVGLRDLGEGICEMKRMFVLPTHQEKGAWNPVIRSLHGNGQGARVQIRTPGYGP